MVNYSSGEKLEGFVRYLEYMKDGASQDEQQLHKIVFLSYLLLCCILVYILIALSAGFLIVIFIIFQIHVVKSGNTKYQFQFSTFLRSIQSFIQMDIRGFRESYIALDFYQCFFSPMRELQKVLKITEQGGSPHEKSQTVFIETSGTNTHINTQENYLHTAQEGRSEKEYQSKGSIQSQVDDFFQKQHSRKNTKS